MTKETPEHLLAEFKLATGKGQLIRANEMAARLFAFLIEADQKAAANACDPSACPCKTSTFTASGEWTPVAGPDHGLITRHDTTGAATVTVPGDLIVTGNVTMGSYRVGEAEEVTPTPKATIHTKDNPNGFPTENFSDTAALVLSTEAVPLGNGAEDLGLVPINTETLEFSEPKAEETPPTKTRKKK